MFAVPRFYVFEFHVSHDIGIVRDGAATNNVQLKNSREAQTHLTERRNPVVKQGVALEL